MEVANLDETEVLPFLPSDEPSKWKGEVLLLVVVTSNGDPPKGSEPVVFTDKTRPDGTLPPAKINGFGTEKPKRGYGGDNAPTHGVQNFTVPDPKWRPKPIKATYQIRTTFECDKPPVIVEDESGDWSLSGLKRSDGNTNRFGGN